MSSPAVRRSTRSRSKPESIYKEQEEERLAAAEASAAKKSRKRKANVVIQEGDDEEHSEDEEQRRNVRDDDDDEGVDELMSSSSSSEDESSDDEEDFTPSRNRSKKTSPSPRKKRKTPSPAPPPSAVKARKIQVSRRASPHKKASKDGDSSSSNQPTRKAVHGALTVLAKRVLHEDETPETSLVAALLQSYKQLPEDNHDHPDDHDDQQAKRRRRARLSANETLYTAQLKRLAQRVMKLHDQNANQAQVDLFNLIFRSVGGTTESMLHAASADGSHHDDDNDNDDDNGVRLDDLNDEELATACRNVMEDMEHTPADSVLLCAHPAGAVMEAAIDHQGHAAATAAHHANSKGSLGAREYRKIYKEFWYQLGVVILSDESGALLNHDKHADEEESKQAYSSSEENDSDTDDTNDDQHDKKKKKKSPKELSSLKWQVEMVKEILLRLLDLVNVTLQDVRAASTLAVYELGVAMLDRTVQLKAKLAVAHRQLAAAKRSQQHVKRQALEAQIATWQGAVSDLERVTDKTVINVFLKRYRDTNEHIRAESIQLLSRVSLLRPDIYLQNSYLKYVGWMLSDKSARVRQYAVEALLAPFQQQQQQQQAKKDNSAAAASSDRTTTTMDTSCMTSLFDKFLGRVVDCVLDVDTAVQQVTMQLLIRLLQEGFLDQVEDDAVWDQINIRAICPQATPAVRLYALQFVLEQLDAFDEGGGAGVAATTQAGAAARIGGLVEWIAHILADSSIPVEHVRYELTDLIVMSLRASPVHCGLASNWSAMLRVLEADHSVTMDNDEEEEGANDEEDQNDKREHEAIRKRVLLRFLVCAAEMEVSALSAQGAHPNVVDADLVQARQAAAQETTVPVPKRKRRSKKDDSSSSSSSHEELTLALLGALPSLLTSYKTETAVLQSLTGLPQYFLPSVFNLSSRRRDFQLLLKRLSEVFLESTDTDVLHNCVRALTSLAQGEHSRIADVQICLKKTARALQDRFLELLEVKVGLVNNGNTDKNGAEDGDDDDGNSHLDTEHSISLCLRRLSMLAKRVYVGGLLVDSTDTETQDEAVDNLFKTVASHVAKELNCRKVEYHEDEEEPDEEVTIPDIWKKEGIHELVGQAVTEALRFLLCTAAWRVNAAVETEEEPTGSPQDHIIVRMRGTLLKLIALCFEMFLEVKEGVEYSDEHEAFSTEVQKQAGLTAGDIRTLFPRNWASSTSPLLAACAVVDDSALIGGFVRFFRSQEDRLRQCEEDENNDALPTQELLLPLARGVAPNWGKGNRREAGWGLVHILGSGPEANRLVTSMSRVIKKIHPVRLLEAHMASLRQEFEEWLESEPEDPPESQRQSDEEVDALLQAEEAYKAKFVALEHLAARLSSTLGVGKLGDKMGAPQLYEFIREGVRYAFWRDKETEDLGARLAFLRILSKYLSWVRRHKESKRALLELFNQMEGELRNDLGYANVLDEDKEAMEVFRKAGDLGAFPVDHTGTGVSYEVHIDPGLPERPGSHQRPRMSMGSSVSSIRSKLSTQGSLSPVAEGSGESSDEEQSSPPPSKRRRLSSHDGAQFSVSTAGRTHDTHDTIEEEEEEEEEDESGQGESPTPMKRSEISSSSAQFSGSTAEHSSEAMEEEEKSGDEGASTSSPSPAKSRSSAQFSESSVAEQSGGSVEEESVQEEQSDGGEKGSDSDA